MDAERETRRSEWTEDAKRESGSPGGGQGRRDEVGHSGVYPMSAREWPPGNAEIRGQAEWGRGERGAAGYEDHDVPEVVPIPPGRELMERETS